MLDHASSTGRIMSNLCALLDLILFTVRNRLMVVVSSFLLFLTALILGVLERRVGLTDVASVCILLLMV